MAFLRTHRIVLTLILVIAFIVLTPLVPQLIALLPWSVVAVCLICAGMAWLAHDRFDTGLALLLAADFALVRLLMADLDPATVTFRTAALTAYGLIHVGLLIGPWSRFIPKIREWYKYRRHIGVTTFLCAFLHASIVFSVYFQRSVDSAWSAVFVFFGSTALFVMTVMAIVSWDWWQKHVSIKTWSLIHAAVLAAYIVELIYVFRLWKRLAVEVPTWSLVAFAGFILFWIIVAPWGLAPRLFKVVNGWKQFHVLVYIAYVSIVLHFYFGGALVLGDWPRPTIIALFSIVAASHAYGWFLALQQKKQAAVIEPKEEPWHDVIAFSDLKESEGRRVDIHGMPVALFLHAGTVRAFFGYCAHQKGPLWQGKIVDGYLTCPWHAYQYSVEDGKGPEGYDDRIPVYETKVENGRVLVKVEKKTQCVNYNCKGCSCRA